MAMKLEPPHEEAQFESAAREREAHVRALAVQGEHRAAATAAVHVYGPEIMRFLYVRLRARQAAEDAFSRVCEDLWLGLPSFAWRSSLRTWLFVLARHAAARQSTLNDRQHRHNTRLEAGFEDMCAAVRTTTATYLRTETKQRVRALREQLDDDQQTLLVLRLERSLAWRELAVVMGEAAEDASQLELERASARVRTRFQAAKRRLRQLAIEAGIISGTADR